jgi:hypothetical protein
MLLALVLAVSVVLVAVELVRMESQWAHEPLRKQLAVRRVLLRKR